MNQPGNTRTSFSPFRINILFALLVLTGAGLMPLLSLQLNPTRYLPSLSVSFSWPDAPARVIEQEVTALIEGTVSTVTGVKSVTSETSEGSGSVNVEFDKSANLRMKRFEIASRLRDLSGKLPEGVSYPVISVNIPSGSEGSTILVFQVNGNAAPSYIAGYAERYLKPAIAMVNGVYSVDISGATRREWEIVCNTPLMQSLGITRNNVVSAINSYFVESEAGSTPVSANSAETGRIYVTLYGNNSREANWSSIPVANPGGRLISLTDISVIRLRDSKPSGYFRINGLNTVSIRVSADRNVNNIKVASEVTSVVEALRKSLPSGFSIRTSLDNTVFLRSEISKNILRAVLSVALLLMFVLAISRQFRYLAVIATGLVANIFISFIFFTILKLEIHLYSLAGITVSFGLVINNTIVMADHILNHRNTRVGISLLAATLTTIGALVVIFFLDEAIRLSLADFAAVVIINLAVSFFIALFLIPSLVTVMRLKPKTGRKTVRRSRRVVRFSHVYQRFIGLIYRFRIAFIVAAILMFGLPVFFLPDSLPVKKQMIHLNEEKLTRSQKLYNKTLGNPVYVQKIKPVVNKVLGGSFRLFYERVKGSRYYYYGNDGEVSRTRLTVNIGLSEPGLTASDLNDICTGLENMLASYDGIDIFTTSVYSAERATVSITFKPEHDFTAFPFILKIKIEDYMNGIGSYHATVYGVGKAFSNQVYSDYIRGTYAIAMKGYNYDQLYSLSSELKERLIADGKGRIKEVFLLGSSNRFFARKMYRNFIEISNSDLAIAGSNQGEAFAGASAYSESLSPFRNVFIDGSLAPVSVKTTSAGNDMWDLMNNPVVTNHGSSSVKLKEIAVTGTEVTDNTITRENQQYVIYVTWDFIGNAELGRMILERNIVSTASLLPVGYSVTEEGYSYRWDHKSANYLLLFLVILIIYIICAVLLESLIQPFIVISLIPFSFIGVFVTFFVFRIPPDEGVFASMILLCGIVVNATLYILNDYNVLRRRFPLASPGRLYIRAFNGKIIPILLTKLSAIIGMIPFLLTGRDEKFWFALAAGTIGGLVFSLIGLYIYQPLMAGGRRRRENLSKV